MSLDIIPSILVPTKEAFDTRYSMVSGPVEVVQLDVLDATFLPEKNFHDSQYIDKLNPNMLFEIHLMINDPEKHLSKWNFSWVRSIIFHIETTKDPQTLIGQIKAMGKEAAVAVNPETPIEKIKKLLPMLDGVLVMTVNPGKNGAPFLPETIDKVREIKKFYPDIEVEVDGGMNPENARLAAEAGATKIVVGSYLKNEEFEKRLQAIQEAVKD